MAQRPKTRSTFLQFAGAKLPSGFLEPLGLLAAGRSISPFFWPRARSGDFPPPALPIRAAGPDRLIPPAMQHGKQPFWAWLQLLARLTLNTRNYAANQPARLAQLDDGNDRAILVQDQ